MEPLAKCLVLRLKSTQVTASRWPLKCLSSEGSSWLGAACHLGLAPRVDSVPIYCRVLAESAVCVSRAILDFPPFPFLCSAAD